MWEQAKALQEGAEIVVCTPVRNFFPICSKTPQFLWKRCVLSPTGTSDRPREKESNVPSESDVPGV